MSRRKPNVSPRVRPSQAKSPTVDPVSAVLTHDGIDPNKPQVSQADPAPAVQEHGGIGDQGEEPVREPPQSPLPDGDFPIADPPPAVQEHGGIGQPEDEPVLGDFLSDRILGEIFQAPPLPQGMISDEPFPGQTPDEGDRFMLQPSPPQKLTQEPDLAFPRAEVPYDGSPPARQPAARPTVPVVAPPSPSPSTQYVQRVTVTDAYRYDGRVQTAPAFIDRNWLSYDDNARHEVGHGTVLAVPGLGIVRVGDWIARTQVLDDGGATSVERLQIYPAGEFERLFMAVPS